MSHSKLEQKPDFDAAYYRRYYLDPKTRAQSPASARRLAAFVAAYVRYLELPVRRVLDVGCGMGRILNGLQKQFPSARCHGVEYSAYLCRKYGWVQASVADYQSRAPYDLVICNDVLPSLDDRTCAAAIDNLAQLCRGALFLGVLSAEDWEICDQDRTDPAVHLRPAAWYRRRLQRHFLNIGGGFWLKPASGIDVWHLDRLGPAPR